MLKPVYYIIIFSSIDVIALAIQSLGGAQAATAMKNGTDAANAGHITVFSSFRLFANSRIGIGDSRSNMWQFSVFIYRSLAMASDSSNCPCQRTSNAFPQNDQIQTLCHGDYCRESYDHCTIHLPSRRIFTRMDGVSHET